MIILLSESDNPSEIQRRLVQRASVILQKNKRGMWDVVKDRHEPERRGMNFTDCSIKVLETMEEM